MNSTDEREYRRLRMAWSDACQRQVERWDRLRLRMAAEQQRLVAGDAWVRGSRDLLAVLGRERREIYHSAILAWLLDPLAPHGLGDRFLWAFLKEADTAWAGEKDELERVRVRCEVPRGAVRADILVETSTFTLVVENKVDAPERPRQCDDLYAAFRDETGDVRFVFLTPAGRNPETANGEAARAFRTVSYRTVVRALEELLLEPEGDRSTAGSSTAWNYVQTLKTHIL